MLNKEIHECAKFEVYDGNNLEVALLYVRTNMASKKKLKK